MESIRNLGWVTLNLCVVMGWGLQGCKTALSSSTQTGDSSPTLAPTPIKNAQLCIYQLTSSKYVGDRNSILALTKSISQKYPGPSWSLEVDAAVMETPVAAINFPPNCNHRLVVSSGTYGIEGAKLLNKRLPRPTFVHLSHQILDAHQDLIGVADFIVLPHHALESSFETALGKQTTTQLVPTVGVVHGLSSQELEEEYQMHQDLLPATPNVMAIVLAGDAQTSSGQWTYFTPTEAQELAKRVATLAKREKRHLIVLNGPRTGKHDPATGKEVAGAHRTGLPDSVSQAFTQSLIQEEVEFTFFDFQVGQPSLYKATLGLLQAKKGPIFVPGESTQMVSECADALPNFTTAYFHGAMTPLHESHILSEFKGGRISMWRRGENDPFPPRSLATVPPSALQMVTQKVLDLFSPAPAPLKEKTL